MLLGNTQPGLYEMPFCSDRQTFQHCLHALQQITAFTAFAVQLKN